MLAEISLLFPYQTADSAVYSIALVQIVSFFLTPKSFIFLRFSFPLENSL